MPPSEPAPQDHSGSPTGEPSPERDRRELRGRGQRRSGLQGWLVLLVAGVLVLVGAGAVAVAATRGPQLPSAPPPVGASSTAATAQAVAPSRAGATGESTPSSPAPSSASAAASVSRYAAALPSSRPERLRIPAIGVDTPLVRLGLAADGTMEVPAGPRPAGWFTGSPTPGSDGPAVLAGHVTYNGPGVFFRLGQLKPGQQVDVTRADGRTAVFTVDKVETYPKDEFPTAKVYGNTAGPELRIITCAGDYDSSRHHYADNVVVYASLTASR